MTKESTAPAPQRVPHRGHCRFVHGIINSGSIALMPMRSAIVTEG
jgi:hypothetical protein